jgi:hypothetical protein
VAASRVSAEEFKTSPSLMQSFPHFAVRFAVVTAVASSSAPFRACLKLLFIALLKVLCLALARLGLGSSTVVATASAWCLDCTASGIAENMAIITLPVLI